MSDDEKAEQLVAEACELAGAFTVTRSVALWIESTLLEAPHIKNHPEARQKLETAIVRLQKTAHGMLM